MGDRVRRPEDDDRAARPAHPPLPHSRNWKRQLPIQEQLSESRQTRKGETSKLDERLTLKPSSSRVSSQWKSRVSSRRKSTSTAIRRPSPPLRHPRESARSPSSHNGWKIFSLSSSDEFICKSANQAGVATQG